MSKKYSMFIGRWQPWHQGHRWLIDQRLDDGKNVLICIRDVEPNENQPWTADEVMLNLAEELKSLIEEGRIKVIKIPDIESINYGRGVGYDVIEHIPPQDVKKVSATKIRAKMRKDGKL
jgi:nicotinamide mononucleotide adenylyltransferase